MTALTTTARTILRSRVRRHPNRTTFNSDPNAVAGMSNGDLVELATLLQLEVPWEVETGKYEAIKAGGKSGKAAIAALDIWAAAGGRGGAGLQVVLDHEGLTGTHADAVTADAAQSEPGNQADTGDHADSELSRAADAKVAEIQALMGSGDFDGFKSAIHALATTALTPVPSPVLLQADYSAPVDAAKISGQVPQITSMATASEVGVKAKALATDSATSMPVFDAIDAPAIDEDYVWPEMTMPCFAALAAGENIFLTGPAGTGKTTFGQQTAARWGRPFVRISCNDQTEAATLEGMTVLDGGNGTKWQDGQLAKAMRKPGTVILIDEPSAARPGALMVLQAALDFDRTLHIAETGEKIKAAPGVVFIAADNTNGTGDENGAYEGTRIMNRATLDRFCATAQIGYLPAKNETRVLVSKTGLPQKHARAIVGFANLTRAKSGGELSHGLGFRRLLALAKLLRAEVDPAAAFQLAVLETAPYDDREPLRQLWQAEISQLTFS